jgi:phosphatidylinositol-3-phosphatase
MQWSTLMTIFGHMAVAMLLATFVASGTSPAYAQTTPAVPAFDHIFIIVMENHADTQIIGDFINAPYINQLATQYAVATNYSAVTHPSLPNYLALIGGSTFGVDSDCIDCFQAAPNIVADRIVPSGRTWKAYMESMPATCFLGDAVPYEQDHNPFMYFDNVRMTSECQKVVQLDRLANDLSSTATTPEFGWLTPNACNDMHDCSVAMGDSWLSNTVPSLLNSPAFTSQNSLLLITWDEDDGSAENQVPMLLIGPSVVSGGSSVHAYNHYSLLKTIEMAWGLAPLTENDAAAPPISDLFLTP